MDFCFVSESFSSVIVNGFCSEVFNVERGVRQGCPLSPLLYVLFSESLSRLLERDSRLVPFVVPGGAKVKCAQYADDVTCVVSSLGSFRALSQDLSIFERATGAKLNPEKTKGLRLGSWRYRDLPFGASWSDQNIKINGIWFGYDAPCDVTWNERAEVFESRLETFGTRWLSILGKVTVLIVLFRPSCGTRARCIQFRVASWCGWRERYFHLFGRVVQSLSKGRYVPKTGEGWVRGGSSGNRPSFTVRWDRALNAIFVQGRHPVEVWRSVHSRLNGCRLRDLAWRIAHGALVTNEKVSLAIGYGLCPRTGCDSLESTAHVFWHCPLF
ncbi:pol-like protein [Apostichopus japonicus]|uniref:Pol-like protein n=1 Tax=Stichopus japonicus TaxID=307972 RepID=A0A2G8JSD0_STIJA|nr:pol-like protein [Apostichopus japonicus]